MLTALYGDGSGGDETDKCTEFVTRVFEPMKTLMEAQTPPFSDPNSPDVLEFNADTLAFYRTRNIARDVAAELASQAPTPPPTPTYTPRAKKHRTATSKGPQPTASSASVAHKGTPSATAASAGTAPGT